MTITDDRIHAAGSQIWLRGFFPHAWFYLLTSSFSEMQLRNSAPPRGDLWMINWSPFSVCLYRVTCLLHHIATLPGLKFSTELAQLRQAGPETQQTCPASQLWQFLRRFHHANVTKRPLVQNWILFGHWRAGKGNMWLPAPVNVNVSLDYLLFVGQRRVGERQTLTDKLYGLGGDSALTKLKEQVLQCLATETNTR